MKKKRKIIIPLLISLTLFCSYFILTPTGSVRFAAIRTGHPVRGLTSKVNQVDLSFEDSEYRDNQFYYLDPTPVGVTGPIGLWKTANFSFFYWSVFFGAA